MACLNFVCDTTVGKTTVPFRNNFRVIRVFYNEVVTQLFNILTQNTDMPSPPLEVHVKWCKG